MDSQSEVTQQQEEGTKEETLEIDQEELKKMSGMDQIRAMTSDFEEMIKFMDFSFETAFQQKDN